MFPSGILRLLALSVAAVVLFLLINGISGAILFANAEPDPLEHADAIVVLGGEHDGREAYGFELAEAGYASTVLLSNPYGPNDAVMKEACAPRPGIDVICRVPEPSTTRGEAIMARELAEARGWRHIIVVSWRYHLPRARRIFDQCFTSPTRQVSMRDVPRDYSFSAFKWQYIFLYQYGAWVKAEIQGPCDDG